MFRVLTLAVVLGACSSVVVPEGGGGSGASGATGSGAGTPETSSTDVTTGPGTCTSHDQCPGGVCLFATGACADACTPDSCDACAPGTLCNNCASSSCPSCKDCLAACIETAPGYCDENDECPAGELCIFNLQYCAPICPPDSMCPDGLACVDCITGSCCGCDDCASACFAPD